MVLCPDTNAAPIRAHHVAVRLVKATEAVRQGERDRLTFISEGQREFSYPWMLFVPAITMVITLFSLNFIGDGLRDAFDPKDR